MKLLNRLLRGLPCSYPRPTGRRGRSNGGGLAAGADAWRRKHREACEECRLRERRERQYLERLRGAAVPAASDDLTARLLARTEELAREARPAAGQPGGESPSLRRGTLPGGAQQWTAGSGVRPRTRFAALAAGSAAAAMALMTGSAYLMGGSPAPLAAGDVSSAFLQKDFRLSAGGGTPDAGTGYGGSLTGEPDVTPAGALTAGQLTALRAQGWTCPELRELGFHLVWARGGVVAGDDMVELRLTDGRHFTTVLEQHARQPAQHGRSGLRQTAAAPLVNVLTGHPAAADGFTAAGAAGLSLPTGSPTEPPPAEGSGRLWVNAAPPFRAIYQGSAGTFTYVSDQAADEAGKGLAVLVRTSAPQRAEPQAADGTAPDETARNEASLDGIRARIELGLGRILELLAP
jgi:hypothetical protein